MGGVWVVCCVVTDKHMVWLGTGSWLAAPAGSRLVFESATSGELRRDRRDR